MPDPQTQPREPQSRGESPERTSAHLARLETRPSFTERNRRIGERIVEGLIFGIAALSIVFIFLIFFFTFREAAPIFFGSEKTAETAFVMDDYSLPGEKPAVDTSAAGATDTSEVYNPESGATPTAIADSAAKKPGTAATKATPKKNTSTESDVYNPESGATPTAIADSVAKTSGAAATKATPKKDTSTESDVYNPESGATPTAIADSAAHATAATGPAKSDTSTQSDVYNPESGAPPTVPTDSATVSAAAPTAAETAQKNESDSRAIVGNDYPILDRETPIKLSYLFYHNWQPNSDHPRYGIYPILVGTLKTTLIALLIAAPLSILAALYTAFFAPKRLRETLKPIIEILAGFPSVVVGFFCLMTVASLVQTVFGVDYRLNAFVGGIGLALAVIPIIYTISDDALRAVPGSLREAALAIGASEWQAAYQIMLPAATPGIFAALLLGLGRAFGETMIALMATGNAGTFNWDFFQPVRTFAATIGAEMGEVQHGAPHYQILFLLGVILFVFSFIINLITEFYVKQRLIKKFRGTE